MKTRKEQKAFMYLVFEYMTLKELKRASGIIDRLIAAKENQVRMIKKETNINI